jgi:hypothetical protein
MKWTIISSISIFTVLCLCSSGCNNDQKQTVEMGQYLDEQSIFEDIKKEYPDIEKNDVCIDASQYFKTLFIVGFFAHDRGCGDEYYYYKGNKIVINNDKIKEILMDNGFENNKTKLIEEYHQEIINHNNTCLYSAPDNFDTINYVFESPKVWIEKDLIISSFWIQQPGGMMPEAVYEKSVLIFKNDGAFESHKNVELFTVSYH